MAKTRIKINEAGVRELYQNIARRIEETDRRFRARWQGKPVAQVEPHVASAFRTIGVNLPAQQCRDYAEAVSASAPFVWKLK